METYKPFKQDLTQEQMDSLKKAWESGEKGEWTWIVEQVSIKVLLQNMIQLMVHQCEVLEDIRESMNQANEPDPDAEPDPFQTLNGSRGPGWPYGGGMSSGL